MKWRSLREDKDVKPIWRNGMELLFWFSMSSVVLRKMLGKYNYHNNGIYNTAEEIVFYISIVSVVLFIVPGIIYLIKPSLFKINRENCD